MNQSFRKWILAISGGVALGLYSWALLRSGEPAYDGKPLSSSNHLAAI